MSTPAPWWRRDEQPPVAAMRTRMEATPSSTDQAPPHSMWAASIWHGLEAETEHPRAVIPRGASHPREAWPPGAGARSR